MRWMPKNPAWWMKAVSKANGFGSISPQVNETDPQIAQQSLERAIARAEAEQARMKIRVLLNKRVKV